MRPSNKTRIINLLHSIDEPLIASDISHHLGLTSRQTASILKVLISQGHVSVRKPQRHLGQRFPNIYWFRSDRHD